MEIVGSDKLMSYFFGCIPWLPVALACFGSGSGFYDPQFPNLMDNHGNIISNYLNIEYRCSEICFDRFEITQSNKGISEIVFWIDKSRSEIEAKFFDTKPDLIMEYGYSFVNKSDSIQATAHIWLNSNYSVSLNTSLDSCRVSISRRVGK